MKKLVDDQFDNIGAVITNNGEDIVINIINTNKKIPKSIFLSILTYTTLGSYERENHIVSEYNVMKSYD